MRLLAGGHLASVPYDFHALCCSGLWVHTPGRVEVVHDRTDSASITVQPWSPRPSFLVIHGLHSRPGMNASPVVRLDGQPIALALPHRYLPVRGTLILEIQGGKAVAVEVKTGR